ncbi:hypothetical protein GBAR_LOCUS17994, partial [Geodia barretti]
MIYVQPGFIYLLTRLIVNVGAVSKEQLNATTPQRSRVELAHRMWLSLFHRSPNNGVSFSDIPHRL